MIGKIISIVDDKVFVSLDINIYEYTNIIGKNVVFYDQNSKMVGEVLAIKDNICTVSLIGEINGEDFIYGDIGKPSFSAKCSFITNEELKVMFNYNNENNLTVGHSHIYTNYPVKIDVNKFFSNHFAILGNSGSGKSYAVAKILQSIFYDSPSLPFKTNIFLFDAYGEYQRAFSKIGENNENINYKVLTTDLNSDEFEVIKIPFWLLGVDDICLLLNITNQIQIPIIEKALKLVSYFATDEKEVIKGKNDIIARALLEIIFSGKSPIEVRNKIISILTKYNTTNINLDIVLTKGGWSRTIRQCVYVDSSLKFADIEIVISYLETLTTNDFELSLPNGSCKYTMQDFLMALEFALISENIMSDETAYSYSNVLKVRLNALINSDYARYFDFEDYITYEDYIRWLLTANNGNKAQIINFNINYVDDRFAKTLVKIYSKLLFDYNKDIAKGTRMPFNIILEEAHRYVQNDSDIEILGYNIFERITKEGRKYGVLLGLITQRPSELSDTAISQCSNFVILRTLHPKDVAYIREMVPNVTEEIIKKLRILQPGCCVAFGNGFKVPVIIQFDMPDPEPSSNSVNISRIWFIDRQAQQ